MEYLFVTVGSTDFDPLVRAVDALMPTLGAPKGAVQIGHGRYLPRNLPYFRFAATLGPYYRQASLIIAHGGLATTMEVLELGIPLISVSNPDRYDHHQDDLLSYMAEEGYIYWCRQLDSLPTAIADVQAGKVRRYENQGCRIHEVIRLYLASSNRAVG